MSQNIKLDPDGAADDLRIPRDELHAWVSRIFTALGSDARESGLMADHLVKANLYGHDSHGISLIPLYARMVREGKVKPNTRVSTVLDNGSLLTLDAGRGFGQAAGCEAMAMGIERAKQSGSLIMALRNSHHLCRIGHWAEQCAEAGLVSVHFVNVLHGAPVVAPYAGADSRLHTNPFAVGVPRQGKHPLVLDFATSRAAQGKMRIAMNRGIEVPPGYLIDEHGEPSLDPGVVYRSPIGALLPFGDHKGAGLAFVCDVLAGALSGAGTLHEGSMEEGVYINNMLSILIDPARLGGCDQWQAELEAGAAYVQASPPRSGMGDVLLPGEIEQRVATARLANGIPVDPTTWRLIGEAAALGGLSLNRSQTTAP
jgi:uncharacterized oxidoreductase